MEAYSTRLCPSASNFAVHMRIGAGTCGMITQICQQDTEVVPIVQLSWYQCAMIA